VAARVAAWTTQLTRTSHGVSVRSTDARPAASSAAIPASMVERGTPALASGGEEDRVGRAVAVQEGGEGQLRVRDGLGQQVGMLDRYRPGQRGGRRAGDGRRLAPGAEVAEVAAAGQLGARDGRRRLRERERLIAKLGDQVGRALALVEVRRQAAHQVGDRFPAAERPHRDDDGVVSRPPAGRRRARGGHQHPAGRASRPQLVEGRAFP
jgi:hypothetical protein